MSRFSFLLVFTGFCQVIIAQTPSRLESILSLERSFIEKLNITESPTTTYIACDFSGSSFTKNQNRAFNDLTVLKVYYVYTHYRLSESFNQLNLDRQRFRWFSAQYPGIMNDLMVDWKIIAQTGCHDYREGDSYFHGFVLVHRPIMDSTSRNEEIQRVTTYLSDPSDFIIEPVLDPIQNQLSSQNPAKQVNKISVNSKAKFAEGERALLNHFRSSLSNSPDVPSRRLDSWIAVRFNVNADGSIDSLVFLEEYPLAAKDQVENAFESMPIWIPAIQNGDSIFSTVNMEIRVSYAPDVHGIYTRDGLKPSFSDEQTAVPTLVEEEESFNLLVKPEPISLKSSAVYKGLDHLKSFQNTALVMDVTGSMTTHIAAMLNWVRTNQASLPFTSYTFFNDGDGKTTKQKKIGKTGGIYLTEDFAQVGALIKEAMLKGNGGEAPENDLEAVTHAFLNDPNAQQVLLIADNYSEVRDLELLVNINRPVHVVLCAAPKFVRGDYLKIAKDTGGFFLLNGQKVDLSGLKKGDVLELQKIEYKYNGSDFEVQYKGEIQY